MPKKEKKLQIEATPESRYILEHYEKIYRDVSDEIVHLTEEIESEIQWLEQRCHRLIASDLCEYELPNLVELRNALERTRNQLRRESYCLLYGSKYTKYFYGEISEHELCC